MWGGIRGFPGTRRILVWCYFAATATPACSARVGGLVGGLPGELRLGAAEVAVGRGLLVDGPAQVQALDNALGREREVLADQLGELGFAQLAGAEGFDEDETGSATPMA
jgi:hypothetical protein